MTTTSITDTNVFMRNLKDALSATRFDRKQFLRQQVLTPERLTELELGDKKHPLTLDEALKIFRALQAILHWDEAFTFEQFHTRILTIDYIKRLSLYSV
jgi:hypothetical protein